MMMMMMITNRSYVSDSRYTDNLTLQHRRAVVDISQLNPWCPSAGHVPATTTSHHGWSEHSARVHWTLLMGLTTMRGRLSTDASRSCDARHLSSVCSHSWPRQLRPSRGERRMAACVRLIKAATETAHVVLTRQPHKIEKKELRQTSSSRPSFALFRSAYIRTTYYIRDNETQTTTLLATATQKGAKYFTR